MLCEDIQVDQCISYPYRQRVEVSAEPRQGGGRSRLGATVTGRVDRLASFA